MYWNRLSHAEQLERLLQYANANAGYNSEQRLSLFLTLMDCYALGYLNKRYPIGGMISGDVVKYDGYTRRITYVSGLKLDRYDKFILTPYIRRASRFWDSHPLTDSDPAVYRKPWTALETGVHLDRLHRYAELYPELTPAERADLLMTLMRAFYTGYFDVPERVVYDLEYGLITKIMGLTDHVRVSSGFRKFRITAS